MIFLLAIVFIFFIYYFQKNKTSESTKNDTLTFYWHRGYSLVEDYFSEPDVIDIIEKLKPVRNNNYYTKISGTKGENLILIYRDFLWYLLIEACKAKKLFLLKKDNSLLILAFIRKNTTITVFSKDSEEYHNCVKYMKSINKDIPDENTFYQFEDLKKVLGFEPIKYR